MRGQIREKKFFRYIMSEHRKLLCEIVLRMEQIIVIIGEEGEAVLKESVIILGSSEGKLYAEKLQHLLINRFRSMNMVYDCVVWSDSLVWENGEVTLVSLINKANELRRTNGFAIVLFTPDDIIELRNETMYCSRDNVWLEYGLFVGIIDKSRVFAVCPKNPIKKNDEEKNWRKPSDFQQYALQYEYKEQLEESEIDLNVVATEIADRINRKFPQIPSSIKQRSDNPKRDSKKLFKPSY